MRRLRGLIVLDADAQELIYGPDELRDITRYVDVVVPPLTRDALAARPVLLRDIDVLFSGWGGPCLTHQLLNVAPNLKAVFHGAGSLASIVTEAVWERDLVVTSAIEANAVPVAEYTLSVILFSLKRGWHHTNYIRCHSAYDDRNTVPGSYGSTVGLVSLGCIGRALLSLLKHFSLEVIVYDPFVTDDEAQQLGVEWVTLDELFERADVVSIHAPSLNETHGMVTGELLSGMRRNATFINTSRGELVREDELITTARRRPDLQFVLDVVKIEPPERGSPLYSLPNVVLTPHLAGSAGRECRRMGRYIIEELERYVAGQPLRGQVTAKSVWNSSHRPFHKADGAATPSGENEKPAVMPYTISAETMAACASELL